MVSRSFLIRLIWAAVALLAGVAAVSTVGLLLEQMGDVEGARITRVVALVLCGAWFVDLVVLVLALAIKSVEPTRDGSPIDGSPERGGSDTTDDVA